MKKGTEGKSAINHYFWKKKSTQTTEVPGEEEEVQVPSVAQNQEEEAVHGEEGGKAKKWT